MKTENLFDTGALRNFVGLPAVFLFKNKLHICSNIVIKVPSQSLLVEEDYIKFNSAVNRFLMVTRNLPQEMYNRVVMVYIVYRNLRGAYLIDRNPPPKNIVCAHNAFRKLAFIY